MSDVQMPSSQPDPAPTPTPSWVRREPIRQHTSRRAVRLVLATSLILGVIADILFNDHAAGINVTLAIASLLAGGILMTRLTLDLAPADQRRWLWIIPIGLCGAAFTCRTSPDLLALNLLAALSAFVMMTVRVRGSGLLRADALRLVSDAFGTTLSAFESALILLQRKHWMGAASNARNARELDESSGHPRLRSAIVGCAVAIPLLLLFGALFASADARFAALFTALPTFDPDRVMPHVMITVFCGMVAMYSLVAWLIGSRDLMQYTQRRTGLLDRTALTIALSSVCGLFAVFLAVQIRVLFGGEEYLMRTEGLTAAEYARSGVFALIAIALLVLLLIAAARHVSSPESDPRRRTLSITLAALTIPVLISAAWRMWIYQQRFALTDTRIYAFAVVLGLGVVIVTQIIIIVRRERHALATVTIIAAITTIIGVTVANPDAMVARANIERAIAGDIRPDIDTLTSLSTDATPTIIEQAEDPDAPGWLVQAAHDVAVRDRDATAPDWQSWTRPDHRAQSASRRHLQRMHVADE